MLTKEYLFYVVGFSMIQAEQIILSTTIKVDSNEKTN